MVPFFGDLLLSEIDIEAIEEYRAFKVKESEARARAIERSRPQRNDHDQVLRPLSAGSINRTIDFLQWVLSVAIEYRRFGLAENPAEGKRRRLRESRPAPVHIDSAAQIEALLEAAAELDRDPRYELSEREAILATLLFAGPRAHELCNLLWRDVDLAGARIFIGRSKTAAGLREIEIQPNRRHRRHASQQSGLGDVAEDAKPVERSPKPSTGKAKTNFFRRRRGRRRVSHIPQPTLTTRRKSPPRVCSWCSAACSPRRQCSMGITQGYRAWG